MKKYLSSLLLAATVITLATGCKGKNKVANDPKVVLSAFFERMANKDFEGASKFVTKDSKTTMDMMKKAMTASEQMKGMTTEKDDPSEDFKNIELGEAKINGDNATVAMTNKKKNETIDFPLKKEDGAWKVDFSMGTLMKMGMNQSGMGDMDMGDKEDMNTEDYSDRMNNMMNSDTITKSLEKLQDELKKIDPKQMQEAMDQLKKLGGQ